MASIKSMAGRKFNRLIPALLALSLAGIVPVALAAAWRLLVFPSSRSVGKLSTFYRDKDGFLSSKAPLCDARGSVNLPSGELISLSVSWDGLNDLRFLKKLQPDDIQGLSLDNGGHGFTLEDNSVDNFVHLRGLKLLSIEQTDIGDSGIKKICQLSDLQLLNVSHTMLTAKGMPDLANLHELTQLELDGTQLNDAALASIAGHTKLISLFIKACGIGPGATVHLQKLVHLKSLRLNENRFGDKGMVALPAYAELTELHLSNCNLTDAGFAQLVKFPKLTSVFARNNKITRVGYQALARCKKLQFVEVTSTPVSLSEIIELRNAPSLTSVWLMPKPGEEEAIKKAMPKITFKFFSQRGKVPLEFFEPIH